MPNHHYNLRKRKHVEISASKVDSWTRSTDIYFDDGNIILVAGNIAFRVHRGQLARHSEVFRDLLLLPQPAGAEVFDESPVVRLTDTSDDVLMLLRALYDNT